MKVVGYCRVSTHVQADKGASLEAQEAKIRQYAALYDLELVDILVDAGVSAKTLKRPALQQALAMLTSGQAEALLVTKLDRLTRSVKDLGTLIDTYFCTFDLMSVGDSVDTRSPSGRLVLNILASVSQWEREQAEERTQEVKAFQRTQGRYLGGNVPYGFTVDHGALIEDPAEQALIGLVRTNQAAGYSVREIAAELTRQGFTTRKGTPFHFTQVARLLREIAA